MHNYNIYLVFHQAKVSRHFLLIYNYCDFAYITPITKLKLFVITNNYKKTNNFNKQ